MSLNPKIENWNGQRVWVIGASYGIGAELGRELIKLDACVALSARSADFAAANRGEHRSDRRAARRDRR